MRSHLPPASRRAANLSSPCWFLYQESRLRHQPGACRAGLRPGDRTSRGDSSNARLVSAGGMDL